MEQTFEKVPGTRTLSVLVVDDEPDVLRLCSDLFGEAGYRVETASTAKEGARRALEGAFDVAVVDYRLPDHQGMALVRWLRRRRPGLAIVMFSAYADWEMFFRACGVGAQDVVSKAFSPRELLRVIRGLTGG
jgi:DNA-binding response OmpR family regulator